MMPTTPTKLDPKLKTIINAVKKAHEKAGAPGHFLALLPDSSQYYVQTKNGAVKHQYSLFGDKLSVICRFEANVKKVSVVL